MRILTCIIITLLALNLSGCIAVAATSAVVGTTVGVAGDIAEGAIDIATPGDDDDKD